MVITPRQVKGLRSRYTALGGTFDAEDAISHGGRKPVEELYGRIHQGPAPGRYAEEAEDRAPCTHVLLRAIQIARRKEGEIAAENLERLDTHAKVNILTSLPKAGHRVRAATSLAEIGGVRSRSPDEESLAALAGVVPVTKSSGKHRSVSFGWAADKKLRNALFAADSRNASPWAANVCVDAIANGTRHRHTVRILVRA